MKNKKLLIPILLITIGVVTLNLDDISLNQNLVSYLFFAAGIVSFGVIYFLDRKKENS
jgi:hypothetical protein